MKAAQLVGPKRFQFVDVEMPTAKDGECLVKLERVSICGSDIRDGYGPVLPEEEYPFPAGKPCHELAGVVVESRTDEFREGQRAIVLPPTGSTNGLVEYIASAPNRMIPLPDQGDLSEWVMCQPSGTVLYSCKYMGNVFGKSVLIAGQGAIGLSFTMLLAKQGADKVIAVDLLDYRLDYAKRFGATHTINPGRQNLPEAVGEITGGVGADITVEAGGYTETLDMSFQHVRNNGMVIIFGIQEADVTPVNLKILRIKQPTIIPTTGGRSADPTSHIKEIVALRERGWVDPAPMVTHRLGFNVEDVSRAYEIYEDHLDNVVKVVMSV